MSTDATKFILARVSDRVYKCDCGYEADRDINACRNIKREGLSILKNKGIHLLKKSTFVAEGKLCLSDMNNVSCSGQEAQPFRVG
ncbi:MAG: putative transposase DNA-binding domain protein [Firmicutes bacterium ADurb.Bin419]|nr:MAG: putative transposase DNA-binding domain protein [Firmicutes bacterium ADurb.Bin419]